MSVEIKPTTEEAPIREQLVETAIKFLQNPNVQKTSLAEQQRFLRRKGLTDAEIKEACEKSGAYTLYEQQQQNKPPLPPHQIVQISPYNNNYVGGQLTVFQRIKEIVHNIAVLSFLGYAIYKFYQKFIAPFLFGTKKKRIEDSLEDLDKNMKSSIEEIKIDLASVKKDIKKISQGAESSTERQLSDLKSEISTVKGLLLSRNSFPQVSKRSSIPAWQKSSINPDSDPDSDPERKAEELMEMGSGSGSEHNTQKSDSSLEIISFSSKDSDFHRRKSKEEETEEDNDKE